MTGTAVKIPKRRCSLVHLYNRIPISRTFKGKTKRFELAEVDYKYSSEGQIMKLFMSD